MTEKAGEAGEIVAEAGETGGIAGPEGIAAEEATGAKDGVAGEAAEIKDGYVGLIRAEKTLAGSLQNPSLTPDVRAFIQEKHNLINTYIK